MAHFKAAQVADVAEKENREPVADQVITTEPESSYVLLLSVVPM